MLLLRKLKAYRLGVFPLKAIGTEPGYRVAALQRQGPESGENGLGPLADLHLDLPTETLGKPQKMDQFSNAPAI